MFSAIGPTDAQEPLTEAKVRRPLDKVVHALEKAEIIPTVLDPFVPKYFLQLVWPKGHTALGNTLKPKHMTNRPRIATVAERSHHGSQGKNWAASPHNIVLTMTDPDAPSRESPIYSEMCHFILHIYLPKSWPSATSAGDETTIFDIDLEEMHTSREDNVAIPHPSALPRPIYNPIVEYKPPGPPPKTGKHRYVFTAFLPANLTSDPLLHLTAPKERVFWGSDEVGGGVRGWAKENDLVPVGEFDTPWVRIWSLDAASRYYYQ
ncbi:MAG: hypothetical protein M1828_001194 [Chrysothrix sp. TS-e1954]|nr:MAG: hypothetical protein M1828_001194 [Chrysothrix sp. TS-e1954]